MEYYLLSVWNFDGTKSSSLCCSTSKNIEDLFYNMSLYNIQEEEIYVISSIINGNHNNQGGEILKNTYYSRLKKEIEIPSLINEIIIESLNYILEIENDYNISL